MNWCRVKEKRREEKKGNLSSPAAAVTTNPEETSALLARFPRRASQRLLGRVSQERNNKSLNGNGVGGPARQPPALELQSPGKRTQNRRPLISQRKE